MGLSFKITSTKTGSSGRKDTSISAGPPDSGPSGPGEGGQRLGCFRGAAAQIQLLQPLQLCQQGRSTLGGIKPQLSKLVQSTQGRPLRHAAGDQLGEVGTGLQGYSPSPGKSTR